MHTKVKRGATPPVGNKAQKSDTPPVEVKAVGGVKKKCHPDVRVKGSKIDDLPEDFDFAKCSPIKRRQFSSEAGYYEYKAKENHWRADVYESKAKESRELGSGKTRQKAKRLRNMTQRMSDLRTELEADGIDVEALLQRVGQ